MNIAYTGMGQTTPGQERYASRRAYHHLSVGGVKAGRTLQARILRDARRVQRHWHSAYFPTFSHLCHVPSANHDISQCLCLLHRRSVSLVTIMVSTGVNGGLKPTAWLA